MPRLGVSAAYVDGTFVRGDVEIQGTDVAEVGIGTGVGTNVALPGFVDLQVNGFAGVDFTSASVDDYTIAGTALLQTGTTTYQPTLVSLPSDAYPEALSHVTAARNLPGPRILGVHLEGPFLSPDRHGAHDPANMIAPDRAFIDPLLDRGVVSMVTLAPELDGAILMIEHLVARGVVVACGHSNADAETANIAFAAGATMVTHLFNAQRAFRHRDPGLTGAALAHPTARVSIIVDGHHLAREAVQLTTRAARRRFVLITDAISATGLPDGEYSFGGRAVSVAEGAARLPDGTLAGSVLTMNSAIRNLIELGISPETAVGAATHVPASALGHRELGTLEPRTVADIAVVDDRFDVVSTYLAGNQVYAR